MILLATNERDLTSDYVVLELRRRGCAFFRLNTETLARTRCRFGGTSGGGWELESPDGHLALADVGAGYFRRPGARTADASVSDAASRSYCEAEWSAVLKSVYWQVGDRWLNPPSAIAAAEDKPRQLALAPDMGFQVPETLVTNDFELAVAFVADGPTIAKPLRQALLGSGQGERVIFTTRLSSLRPGQEAAFAVAPVILQREIAKVYDVRVTVVGDRAFAASIASQERTETIVDWRRGGHLALRHAVHDLPAPVRGACVEMTKALGLRFSAIDLVFDAGGRHWFLECNPNGQWAWIQNQTGMDICAAVVDELQALAAC